MVTIIRNGNILESKAQTLVNTVNCEGVMGRGIALAFKEQFPDMYKDYEKRCKLGMVKLGRPYLYTRLTTPWILNFATKQAWRSTSRLSDIIDGLDYVVAQYQEWGITSIAFPPLGCGQGGLDWRDVGPVIYSRISRLKIPVELYAPHEIPDELSSEEFLSGRSEELPDFSVKPELIVLAAILDRIYGTKYHWPIGRTTFQKIAYFATALGLPSGLQFRRGSYGPYSDDLKRYIQKMINGGLIEETQHGQVGKLIINKPGPMFSEAKERFKDTLEQWDDLAEKIADLFLRIRTTQQAELYATVHKSFSDLVSCNGKEKKSELDVFYDVLDWKKKHRPPIDESQLADAIRELNMLNWLDLKLSEELPVSDF